MKNDKIYPMAYKLTPGQTRTLYYLGFPKEWKELLLDIESKKNPRFKDEYGLPTNALKKLIDSWMEGIIALSPLKKDSCDKHWLTSFYQYSQKDIEALCEIIKVWVKATYDTPKWVSPKVKQLADDFCNTIKAEDIAKLQDEANVCLTLSNETVCDEAYQAIPLLAINRLLKQEITLSGQPLYLCYSAKNQLISQPITDPKSNHKYSFVFDFSVQTTPPQRIALLLCQISIRRWIPDNYKKERTPFLSEGINAHIKVSDYKYCQVHIDKKAGWKKQDEDCYNIWGYEQLPPVKKVLSDPAAYSEQILLPYKNGMGGFTASKIGTGVSVVDKASLYRSIGDLLGDMIGERPEASRVAAKGKKFQTFNSPQEYADREEFRKWVHKCAETDQIIFEFYGLWKDDVQHKLLNQVQDKIENDFGENSETSCLNIRCVCKEIGGLANNMDDDSSDGKRKRCEEIIKELGQADTVTACICVIPDREHYEKGDPKQVLRNAFARSGRVVQFITPESEKDQNAVDNAVYDLYRQLGVVTLLNFQKKMPTLANIPCVGMHIFTQIHGISNKARFLPIYVTVDLLKGKIRVHCDAFDNTTVSYREACLETAKLFWKSDLEQRCINAVRSPVKQKLIELKNLHYNKDDGVLFMVQSDGNTRALWSGISDKEIGGYKTTDKYCPYEINAGTSKNPYPISLKDTGVRIIRIRSNQEVPDYYTGISKRTDDNKLQYSSASGIFGYVDAYWGINERPYDTRYTSSFKDSRITHPQNRFAEKDMIELYPLQLQSGDNADDWIFYTNALRHVSIQYNQSTVLPLPLHLAKALEEYLFDV